LDFTFTTLTRNEKPGTVEPSRASKSRLLTP
jgi:hypothetical protein